MPPFRGAAAGLRAIQKKGSDRLFQVREAHRLGLRARMKNNIPPRAEFRQVPADRFAQPPLEPVPFDRAAEGARNRQSHPAGRLSGRPDERYQNAEVAPATLRVHFPKVGGAQQARALGPARRDVLSRRRPLVVAWSNHIVSRRGRLLGRDGQAFPTPLAPPRQNFAPARRPHPRSKPVGLRPLPLPWLIRPLRHAARASSRKPLATSRWQKDF